MELPGVEKGTSYGTPALHVRKKFLARLKEDGETVALRVDLFERDVLLELDRVAFYVTDHYRPYPAMLVRLKQVRVDMLQEILEHAWRLQARRAWWRKRRATALVRSSRCNHEASGVKSDENDRA